MRRISAVLLAAAAIGFGGHACRGSDPVHLDGRHVEEEAYGLHRAFLPAVFMEGCRRVSGRDSWPRWPATSSGAIRVEPEFVETTFRTVVLDLQSAKCHAFFGFNATPERALAIDFSGPLYTLGFGFVNGKGWKPPGPGWADFNSPDIKICYPIGTSMEQQAKRWAPKAQHVALGTTDECILALQTGRVDTFLTAFLDSLVTKLKNPNVGRAHVPDSPHTRCRPMPACGLI